MNKLLYRLYRSTALLFSMVLLLSLSACTQVEVEGKPAPEFTLEKVGGGTISSSELKKKAVMLYWFAGW